MYKLEIDNRAVAKMTGIDKDLIIANFGLIAASKLVAGFVAGMANSSHLVRGEQIGIGSGLVFLSLGGLNAMGAFRRKSSGDGVG